MRILFGALALMLVLVSAIASAEVVENEFYKISPDKIIRRVKVGEFKEIPVFVSNYRQSPVTVGMYIDGNISNTTTIDKLALTLEPGSSGNFSLTFFAERMGKYNGSIVFTGEIQETLQYEMIVTDLSTSPVNALGLTVDAVNQRVEAGKKLSYKVDVQNFLGERGYDVMLFYSIDRVGETKTYLHNRSFFEETETVKLENSVSMFKEFQLPEFLKQGEYILNVKAEYLGLTVNTNARFFVIESALDYMVLGLIPVRFFILSVLAISLAGGGFVFYKKKLAKKQRYVSKLNLSLLPKQGPRSVFLGKVAEKNVNAFFDLEQMQTHTITAGSTGGGKTFSVKVLIEEALLKGVSVIIFDPTAQWTGILRRNQDKKILALYEQFGMKKTDARGFNGNIRQILNARQIIDIKKFMKPGEISIFAVNTLEPKDIDIIVLNTVRQVFKANLPESKELKLLIVFDEVHRLLPKFGGSGQGFVQIERGAREFRKWGVGLVLISQVLTDFVGEIKANINTEIQMRTRDQGDLDRIKTKYGEYMLQSLLKATTGTGMIQNSAFNNGDPYFISFRPLLHEHARLSDEELASYDKYNKIIDDLEYQIEQLEEFKVDSFDMRLDLKMAQDKVKAGSFNMVEIYMESLLPRLKGEWAKLGKEPKKKEMELVNEAELQLEFQKAQAERKKAEEVKKKGNISSATSQMKEELIESVGKEMTEPFEGKIR